MIYTFDFGGTAIKGIKFDAKNKALKKYHLAYKERAANGLNVELKHALTLVKEIILSEKEKTFELGLSLPGVIDSDNLKINSDSAFVNVNVDLKDFFKDCKGLKDITIINDGKAALLGELSFGGKNNLKSNYILMTIGTSVGGAAYVNGEILKGDHWFAGEYSRSFVDMTNVESLEQASMYCGTMQAVFRFAKMKGISPKQVNGQSIFAAYIDGDEDAVKLLNNWTTALGKLIINTNLVIDASKIFIGGGISEESRFIDLLTTKLASLSDKVHLTMPTLVASKLKNDAGCYGALQSVLNRRG